MSIFSLINKMSAQKLPFFDQKNPDKYTLTQDHQTLAFVQSTFIESFIPP